MTTSTATRRRFLARTATATALLGLAGCTAPGSVGGGADTPESTATETHEENDHDQENHDEHTADEHGHNHDEGRPESASHEAHVKLRTEDGEHHFDPHVTWIDVGGEVTWENERGQHNALAYHPTYTDKPLRMPDGADPWTTDILTESGDTASHTFETEGVYDYYCTPHEGVGMVGTVLVGEPDAHGPPALEEPQDSLPEGARHELTDLAETVNEILGHTH